MSEDDPGESLPASARNPARGVVIGMIALLAGAALAFFAFRQPVSPPPAEIANDPLLVQGREAYLARCVSCHGTSGKGDGPIAKGLSGPPPGDLTDATWKHGDQPDQVLAVVTRGVKDTAMPGWRGTFSAEELRAVSAYVYYLNGRPVPKSLREP